MKFLVIGCGSIGQRHLKNLISLNQEVIACDLDENLLESIKTEYNIKSYRDYQEAISQERSDAVLICTPNKTHLPIALHAAQNDCNIFIEKPISHTLEGINSLIDMVESKNLVVLVGCNMRFHRAIQLIKERVENGEIGRILSIRAYFGHYLPNWRPSMDYRKLYSAKSDEGGILLDGIHEFDYITWISGDVANVFCLSKKVSPLEIDSEDLAEVILGFESGAIGQIHLDYLRHNKYRSLEVIGDKGTLFWHSDGKAPEHAIVNLYSNKGKIEILNDDLDPNEMYVKEIQHFIKCIKGTEKPVNDIESAKKSLELIIKAKNSVRRGKLSGFKN